MAYQLHAKDRVSDSGAPSNAHYEQFPAGWRGNVTLTKRIAGNSISEGFLAQNDDDEVKGFINIYPECVAKAKAYNRNLLDDCMDNMASGEQMEIEVYATNKAKIVFETVQAK
jgi:hypothetical protein